MSDKLQAYLFHGDEFLARQAAQALLSQLLPEKDASLSLQTMDSASPREIAAELSTLSLFPGPKVVLIHDPEFLLPQPARGGRKADPLVKAKDAWKAGRRKEGARRVLALAAKDGWRIEKGAGATSLAEALGSDLGKADLDFLAEVLLFAREEGLTAPEDDTSELARLLDRGLPEGHALVVVASEVDLKSSLVKKIQEVGQVAQHKVASTRDGTDLSAVIRLALGPFKKKLGTGAEAALLARCGPSMRLLQNELIKLALHASGDTISRADVEGLVGYVREESYMDLSEALQRRDLKAALGYAARAKEQGSHELMMLGAVASIVRSLLTTWERLKHLGGGALPRSYKDFQSSIFPKIEREAKELGTKVPHPYAAFKSMEAAAQFKRAELLASLRACAEADLALKSSAPSMLTLERVLWTVCGHVQAS